MVCPKCHAKRKWYDNHDCEKDAYMEATNVLHRRSVEQQGEAVELQRLLLQECRAHTAIYERIAKALEPKIVNKLKKK